MARIRKTHVKLSPEKIRSLKALARRIDARDSVDIVARGREAFAHHQEIMGVVQALKTERLRRGLSLTDMAAQTGIAKPNLSRLENVARTTPRLDTLRRYAQALGLDIKVELIEVEPGC
ncbi:MAG: helix-turn-helix transcriptional regulator [Phycisphaeraceae bacterium]|nr:helix-turn-helix transcriptional regulator [Phycisphaeraceae bacterium]